MEFISAIVSGVQNWYDERSALVVAIQISLLLVAIALLTLSGTLVQMARFQDWALAYHLYFFHLVAVWFVIMYLPFTKLGHVFYRTTALLYARSIGRK